MEKTIRYSERIESTRLLGPGDRAVLWVFGCCFDCPGCIAYNFKHGSYYEDTVDSIVDWILSTGKKDITISGGEPMLQAEKLATVLEHVRQVRDMGVIVYSGYIYEDLQLKAQKDDGIHRFLNNIDILIDGPFVEALNDNDPYRGSSNQRIISLTSRYSEVIEDYYYKEEGRKIEVRMSGEKTLMIGVPSKNQTEIWRQIKNWGE